MGFIDKIAQGIVSSGAMPASVSKPWEESKVIQKLRVIAQTTSPKTRERHTEVANVLVDFEALLDGLKKNIMLAPLLPSGFKQGVERFKSRVRNDPRFATEAFSTIPEIADRYGQGRQKNGQQRLSFLVMMKDQELRRLIE